MGLSKKERREQKVKEVVSGIFDVGKKIVTVKEVLEQNWHFLLFTCLAIVAVYFNGMNADFVSDDYASITLNPTVKVFSTGVKHLSLVNFFTWFLATVFDTTSPIPFHIFSLLVYLACLVLIFVFLRRLFDRNVARIATLFFAFLPIHVEGVTWISGKPYIFNTLTMMLCLNLFLSWVFSNKKKYMWWFIVSIPVVYMGDKIRSFALPFLISLIYMCFRDRFVVTFNFKKFILYAVPVFLGVLVLLLPMIRERVSQVNAVGSFWDLFYNPFYQYPTSINKYLQLIFFPIDLTLYHTLYASTTVLNWMTIIFLAALFIWSYKKHKGIFFGLAFAFIAAFPSMAPMKVSWLVAERYFLLGSMGISIVVAFVFDQLSLLRKEFAYAVLGLVLAIYSVRIFARNIDWQTNHNLWVNTCYVSPNSHNAWNNIGDDYDKLKDYPNAIKGFTQSTVVKPDYADAFHNRGNILFKIARFDLARDSYLTAISLNPGLFQSRLSLIQVSLTAGDVGTAVKEAFTYVQQRPDDPVGHYALGFSLIKAGRTQEAKMALARCLQLNPGFVQAKELLGQIN